MLLRGAEEQLQTCCSGEKMSSYIHASQGRREAATDMLLSRKEEQLQTCCSEEAGSSYRHASQWSRGAATDMMLRREEEQLQACFSGEQRSSYSHASQEKRGAASAYTSCSGEEMSSYKRVRSTCIQRFMYEYHRKCMLVVLYGTRGCRSQQEFVRILKYLKA